MLVRLRWQFVLFCWGVARGVKPTRFSIALNPVTNLVFCLFGVHDVLKNRCAPCHVPVHDTLVDWSHDVLAIT